MLGTKRVRRGDVRLACQKCGRTVSLEWARDRGFCPWCFRDPAYDLRQTRRVQRSSHVKRESGVM